MAGLLLGLFMFLLAMTHFESLHRAIHADARQPNHQCAVTMLQAGQVDAPPASAVSLMLSPVAVVTAFSPPAAVFVSFDFTLLPSCGPPALLS